MSIEATSRTIPQARLPLWRQLRTRLLAYSVLLAVLPLTIVSVITLPQRIAEDRQQVFDNLNQLEQQKTQEIERWVTSIKDTLALLVADQNSVNNYTVTLTSTDPIAQATAQGIAVKTLHAFQSAHSLIKGLLTYDLQGKVMAASNDSDIGKTVAFQPYFTASLASAGTPILHTPFYPPGSRELVLYATDTINSADGHLVGVLAMNVNLDALGAIMKDDTNSSATRETYLVSQQNDYLLTPSRFPDYIQTRAYHSEGIDLALSGKSGSGEYIGYRGQPVLGVYQPIPDLQAGLMAEIEVTEALNASTQLRNVYLGVALGTMFLATLLALGFSTTFARPISLLTKGALAVAFGDYTLSISVRQRTELGQLTEAFNIMTRRLAAHIEALRQLNDTLETRVAERTHDLEVAAEQLRALDRLKSQFLASMSHELRTPLNAILNFTDFVAKGVFGPVNEEQVDALDKANSSGRHLLSLINDVLDVAKIQAGMMQLFIEQDVDLKPELETVVASIPAALANKPVEFIQDIDATLPKLAMDRRRVRQILLNLLSNAAKFTDSGRIVLKVEAREVQMVFTVTDTGPGIEKGDQEIIFEPFKQTSLGLKQASGTGLGLYISRQLAEAHGGKLWVESVPGKGSIFCFTLPVRSGQVQSRVHKEYAL